MIFLLMTSLSIYDFRFCKNLNETNSIVSNREAAFDMAMRIVSRVLNDAKAGHPYAIQILDEEVFSRK